MNAWHTAAFAYHRRWYWKYLVVSYLCTFSAGWVVLRAHWFVAFYLFACGMVLAFLAGTHASKARRFNARHKE